MKFTQVVMLIIVLAAVFFGAQYLRIALAKPTGSDYSQISSEALAYFQTQKPGLTNLTAKVINYGCHFEIDILQGGTSVGRVGWAGPGSYYIIR